MMERIDAAKKLKSYKYRDPVKRRAQVAAAMRKWRSRKARRGGVGTVRNWDRRRGKLGQL